VHICVLSENLRRSKEKGKQPEREIYTPCENVLKSLCDKSVNDLQFYQAKKLIDRP
jgi:hypothetical protein